MKRAMAFAFLLILAMMPILGASSSPNDPAVPSAQRSLPPNPLIDYTTFSQQVKEVEKLRAGHRVTEQEFLEMTHGKNTVVLDARSKQKYALLHVQGAKNLTFPDITASELAKILPTKDTRVLIYCNNNFVNEPISMPTKVAPASLNIHTFTTLYSYGYKNVYELGPKIDIKKTILPFEGTLLRHP